jgi:hypothetical protein
MTYLINDLKIAFTSDYGIGIMTMCAFAVGLAISVMLIDYFETKYESKKEKES